MSQENYLHDWVFHFNPLTNYWAAIPIDKYKEYWNNYSHPDVIRSKELKTLISILNKTKGDRTAIVNITNDKPTTK
jgi:hypothetical protein